MVCMCVMCDVLMCGVHVVQISVTSKVSPDTASRMSPHAL